ncbi:Na+/H+ antiporter [Gorillibacterium sp. sgz500922]|uniref:Na+/H+ antiporter n=1 Tax=Gorillibacterium sp. sgz500922 TaxID=3446694 RepID=UPI003F66B31E
MDVFLLVLILLILISISHVIGRFVPFVPVPLLQIALGVGLAFLPMGIHMELEPELFFVLFIAPLLFNDGRRTPREELWQLKAPILMLALGLVFITVFAGGYFIHWLIPSIPLPAAFALAAILSPTDAVAVSSMAGRVHLPERIHRILEGEALMNDASGLVAFKFAVAAMVTGAFSLPKASLSFVVIAVGGLLVGALLAFLILRAGELLRRFGMEDVTIHVLLQLMTPFIIYLVSEEIGVSGILAVVAAGLLFTVQKDRALSPQYKLQLVSASTWSVLLFILNGMVFLLLGLSVPDVMDVIIRDEAISNWTVTGYVLLIAAFLIIIRFLWIWLFSKFQRKRAGKVRLKSIALTSISGVRGAVTLAGAFSIPLVTQSGAPFPERDLILALAAGVILVSLVLASVVLPLLADKAPAEETTDKDDNRKLMEIGINRLRALTRPQSEGETLALSDIQEKLNQVRPDDWKFTAAAASLLRQITGLRLTGLRAERQALHQLKERGELDPAVAAKLAGRLDQTEMLLTKGFDSEFRHSVFEVGRMLSGWFAGDAEQPCAPDDASLRESLLRAKEAMVRAGLQAVRAAAGPDNQAAVSQVASRYERYLFRLEQGGGANLLGGSDPFELERRIIQEQRDAVQQMYEDGTINRRIAGRLRKLVDELEASIWES